ncbi:hypothetical protein CkaCkLH20_06830 [Colletotrichum karsti]|uniref:Uncharacterized protein n=1 Tax=Colletotrichum karsti TaxID=1095194 RepID=A0A9P6I3T6_9PEZI|nr:uncharacterized protein CkaCkLH20_06830 [Colletotrichum karsti]KAF9875898.1 hypothetical protein CkaCkLH20_06830 [Colletotrichum karsti]
MPPYSYRPPPSGRQYYPYEAPPPPPNSAFHYNDWHTALPLPNDFYVHACMTSPAAGFYSGRSPGRSPSPDEEPTTSQPAREEPKRSGKGKGAAQGTEGVRKEGGASKGEDKSTGKEIVKATPLRADAKTAQRREQWLVEIRLLISQIRVQLSTAYFVHKESLDAFNQHITEELKEFADDQTLIKLWVDKLRSTAKKYDGKRAREKPANFDTVTAQVRLCLKHLKSASEKKVPAVPGSEAKDVVIDSQTRVVVMAVEEALSWAETAGSSHHACEEAVEHLDRAYNFTDTDGNLWRALLDIPAASHSTSTGDTHS